MAQRQPRPGQDRRSRAKTPAERAEEAAEIRKRGMQVVELPPDAAEAYLNAAYDEAWNRLKERDPTHYEALREKFFQED